MSGPYEAGKLGNTSSNLGREADEDSFESLHTELIINRLSCVIELMYTARTRLDEIEGRIFGEFPKANSNKESPKSPENGFVGTLQCRFDDLLSITDDIHDTINKLEKF